MSVHRFLSTAFVVIAVVASSVTARGQFGGLSGAINKAKKAVDSVKTDQHSTGSGQQPAPAPQPSNQPPTPAQQPAASQQQPQTAQQPVAAPVQAPQTNQTTAAASAPAPAPPAQQSSTPKASTGESLEFTRSMYSLMTLRDIPQFYGEQILTGFAVQQISIEQQFWKNISGGQENGHGVSEPPPSITYEWQKLIDQQPALAGGPLLDVFLHSSPDWSFLNSDPKWDANAAPQLMPVIGVLMFSREKIEGRQPEFAARELMPVVKRQFEMLAKKLPAHFYFTEQLPMWKYNFDVSAISFQLSPQQPAKINMLRPVFDPETKSGTREAFNKLPASAKAMMAYSMVAGGDAISYQVPKYQDPPQVHPGHAVGGLLPEFGWKESFSFSKIPEPILIALDRQLQLTTIPLEIGRAEQLTKLGGLLTARIYFTADHIELEDPAATQLDRTTPTILFAKVEKVEIVDREGGLVATLQPAGFRAAKDAMASLAAPTAAPAKPAAPAPQPTGETNEQRVARENKENWEREQAKTAASIKKVNCESTAETYSHSADPKNAAYKKYYDQCMQKP